jgi:hypothetical protein
MSTGVRLFADDGRDGWIVELIVVGCRKRDSIHDSDVLGAKNGHPVIVESEIGTEAEDEVAVPVVEVDGRWDREKIIY